MQWLFSISLAAVLTVLVSAQYQAVSDEFINKLNKEATTWTAGRNFNKNLPMSFFKRLMGLRPTPESKKLPKLYHPQVEFEDLPAEFDSRAAWPKCPSIAEITDQGNCGSCWAIAPVEVMTDRTCISSGGAKNFHYSVEDVVACDFIGGSGCDGGYEASAFHYWIDTGIVSGGAYNSSQGCLPYEIAPCEHYVDGPRPRCSEDAKTPICVQKCEPGYSVRYEQDLHKGKVAYSVHQDEKTIMSEILKNGPVKAGFEVYGDFLNYKSGVYKYTHGDMLGRHAVKILGWGEENGVKYWLCANSWNSDWGDKGYFKILKGSDEGGIEEAVDAGLPMDS